MIVLLGGSGYVGSAFRRLLEEKGIEFSAPSHRELDLTLRDDVAMWFRAARPRFVINAVGFTGRPNIDSTEKERWRCLQVNTVVPGILAEVLGDLRIPWGHVSSGCIYNGSHPDGSGFTEDDEPEFVRSDSRAGWYAKTKWMAEMLLREMPGAYVWRLRIPFDQFDNPRNYISKLRTYESVLEVRNSISQLQDFARAAYETLDRGLPPGIYNITNPGSVLASEIVAAMRRHGLIRKDVHFFDSEADFMNAPGRVYRANCILSSEKLRAAGIEIPDIREALEFSLANWHESSI